MYVEVILDKDKGAVVMGDLIMAFVIVVIAIIAVVRQKLIFDKLLKSVGQQPLSWLPWRNLL